LALASHTGELLTVVADVSNFMGDGKVQHPPPLHVKANDASPAPTGRRRPSVRIGQRYLFIRGGAQDRRKVLERGHLLAQRRDLVLQ
jgi:hypothetical protein